MYLQHDGFRCIEAADGGNAAAMAHAHAPALVLMDATMPGVDGWEALRRLHADPDTSAIPVILFSGHASQDHRERAMALGATEFLAKPVLPDVVAHAIRRILKIPA